MFNRWTLVRVALTSVLLAIAVKVAVIYSSSDTVTLVPAQPDTIRPAPIRIASPTTAQSTGDMMVYPLANFDVQGHRGARGLKPENTLPAFEVALDLGVDTLELDLHLTADDVVVIWHDPTIEPGKCYLDPSISAPTAPDPEARGTATSALMIRQLTFEQLQQYRCDRNPDPRIFPDQDRDPTELAGDRYQILRLEQLFDFVAEYNASPQKEASQRQNGATVRFNLETKRQPRNPATIGDDFDGVSAGTFERAIVDLVERYNLTNRVTIQSFDHRSLWAVKQIAPQIRLSALISEPAAVDQLAAQGSAILSPRFTLVTPTLLAQAHAQGLKVIPWTVNEPEEMERLIVMGVDGLITDRPDLLLALEKR
jgi:glycerophosphoryl diester phosphodiesterase